MPLGAEIVVGRGVHFRVHAPDRRAVSVVVEGHGELPLAAEEGGWFSGLFPNIGAGALYAFRLDDEQRTLPDPASRFQPHGPHGPSQVIDPHRFRWTDDEWSGLRLPGQVIYEMHVGAFTREGTWDAATAELPMLAELGVTAVEVMPVAEFPGRFGWGYDGVDLFAPTRLYGPPDAMRRFVDRAHALGIGVLLDVVYNHMGPDGCYLREFSKRFFSARYQGEWGDPLNFDDEGKESARTLVVENAAYWIREFHVDGLRVDATQGMFDSSETHVLVELSRRARREAGRRSILLVGENEPQDASLLAKPEDGGAGFDALWNDDLHHAARVAATGRSEAYYVDYKGSPQELISAAKRGFLYQGQRYLWQKKRRGTPTRGLPPERFVAYLQNHDQVANSAAGERLHALTSPARLRALTTLLLLGPWTPMLFMGQERGSEAPFLYFADHHPELAHLVKQGRAGFLAQFPSIDTPEVRERLADPGAPETFEKSKLRRVDDERARRALALHRDLLELRRTDETIRLQGKAGLDGAVLGERAFCLRMTGARDDDRLLVVNLGPALPLQAASEPLLAPPSRAARWRVAFTSEDPRYGGGGTAPPSFEERGLSLPAEIALLLAPEPA